MDNAILVARLLGPVLLVIGLTVLAQPERIRALAREFLEGEALLFLSGLSTLLAGLAIVNARPGWNGWPAVVSIFGWLMVLAGVARLAFPDPLKALGRRAIDRVQLRVPGAVFAVLGAFLSAKGYL
jgi:hypothetical protein